MKVKFDLRKEKADVERLLRAYRRTRADHFDLFKTSRSRLLSPEEQRAKYHLAQREIALRNHAEMLLRMGVLREDQTLYYVINN